MTTNYDDLDALSAQSNETLRLAHEILARCNKAKAEQPERLAKARTEADEARGWAIIEEPWSNHVTAIPAHDANGNRTGGALNLPSIQAKELWAARLAFDLLDCNGEDDSDRADEVINRLFTMVDGDTGLAMLLMSSALTTIATLVVPQLLEEIERAGSNWDERVRLCQARAKAWNARLSDYPTGRQAAEDGVRPIDGYDIGAAALDPEDEGPAYGHQ